MKFTVDLLWERDRDEIIELADSADVIHLHNYLDLRSVEFAPLSFANLWRDGKALVRQFHSTPELVARFMNVSVSDVLNCPIPKLVIAQYPERYYPDAAVVPNIPLVEAKDEGRQGWRPIRVGYAPSRFNSARSARWDTKGYNETMRMLREVRRTAKRRGLEMEVDVIEQVPHADCLVRKAACDVIIDDLVTGSYHLNTLESLAQGTVCLSYLDQRSMQILFDLIGRADFPVVNVRLEDAASILLNLVREPAVVQSIGEHAKEWMKRYWDPMAMGTHFLEAYDYVLQAPNRRFPARFDVSNSGERWRNVEMHDVVWRNRWGSWPDIRFDMARAFLRGATIERLKKVLSK